MRDAHQRVVDDHRVVVGGDAVGAHEHRVADHLGVKRHRATHEVGEATSRPAGTRKRIDRRARRRRCGPAPARGHARQRPRTSAASRPSARPRGRPRAARASRSSGTRDRRPAIAACARYRCSRSTGDRARPRRRRPTPRPSRAPASAGPRGSPLPTPRRALEVGVLDAQHEGAAVAARGQPVEQRGPRVADVQVSGGAGREAQAHQAAPPSIGTSRATAWHAIASPAHAVLALVGLALHAHRRARHAEGRRQVLRIASTCGSSLGRCAITVTSTLPTR